MAKGTIGGKIVLEGESQYREALKKIKTEQTELRSEMRLCQSTFKDNQNSLDALKKKHEILTKQIDSQTKKVEVYQKALLQSTQKEQTAAEKVTTLKEALEKAEKEMKDMKGSSDSTSDALEDQAKVIEDLKNKLTLAQQDYDKAAQKTTTYKTSVNNAQAELQGMQGELKKTEKYIEEASNSTDKCAKSIDEYGKEVKEAEDDTSRFGDVMKANLASDVIKAGLSKLADLAKKVGEELSNCAVAAAQYADNIMTTATNTGIAAETLQELTYAQELMDVSIETVTSAMAKNIKSMDSAQKGSSQYAEAYKKLGISVIDGNNQLRDSEDVFWEIVDALGAMENETQRDAISMQIFGKKAQDLNSLIAIGSKGFKELATEAHNTGFVLSDDVLKNLLKTSDSMERMKNRVTAVKNNIGGELAPTFEKTFDRIGDAVEDAEDDIIDFAEDTIPLFIDGLEWIIKNADIVVSGITGITAATIYHSAIAPAITAVTAAWKAYKTANEGATVSQWLLNTAMNANPAGLLITSVVGLTAAVSAYVIANKDNISATDEVTKSTREQVNAAKELNEQYASASSERADARQNLEAEAIICKNLVTELQNLSSKQNLSNTEQTRMKMIVEQLNQKMPELNLQIDKQTGKLNMSTDALKDNVDAMMAMAKAEAAREDLTRIAEDQYEAEKQLAKLEKQLEEQKLAVADAQDKANESMREAQELYGDNTELMGTMGAAEANALIQAQDAQKSLEEQIESTKQTINGFTDEYSETMQYISDTEGLATATEATAELGATAENTSGQIVTMSEEAQEAYQNMFEKVSDAVTSQMDLFSEFNSSSQLTTEQLLSNMQSQVDGISQWSANIAELADRGISQGLLQTLSEMGPEGAGYVSAFVSMTDEELQKASGLFEESLKVKDEAINEVMQSYQDAGSNMVKSLSDGIEENKDLPKEASATVMKETIDAANEEAEINSPSGKTEESGLNLDKGLEKGINGGKEGVIKCMQSLISDMIVTAQEGLKESTFEEIGKKVASGLQSGIESGKSGVLASVDKMKSEVKSSMDDINSVIKESMPNPSSGATKSVSENSQASMYTKSAAIESIRDSMSDINAVIRESLPDTSMMEYSGSSSKAISEQASAMDVEKYTDAIVNAINKKMTQLKIVAQSDTANLFRFMVKENNKNIMSTGINKMNR